MKKSNIISSGVLFTIALFGVIESARMPFGTLQEPKQAFWPLILSVCLAIFSCILLGQAIKERSKEKSPFWESTESCKRICLAMGGFFIVAFFFEKLGHLMSAFFLMVFLLRIVEPLKIWLIIVFALLTSLVTYLVFGILLKAALPAGILGI